MSWLTKWSFRNKAAVMFMTVIILAMGIFSYVRLPMEFLPSADQPFISIVTVGQGVDSKTMEEKVTVPIEKAISGVDGRKNIFSTTGDGFSKVDIHFDAEKDKKEAKREIDEALTEVNLPASASKPSIVQLNTSMIPVSYVAIAFKDGVTPANVKFAEEELVPFLKDVEGVTDLQTFGAIPSYVSVNLNEAQLGEKNVSVQQVLSVLQGRNMVVSIGQRAIDGKTSNLQVISEVSGLEDLKELPVSSSATLADIADITIKKPENSYTRVDGKDGLFLVVTKDSHSNVVTVSDDIKKATEKVNEEYGDRLSANVFINTADMVESSVHSMMKEVLLGALFATLIIMLFLRNIRSTFITIVSIPLSLGLTLFLLAQSGVTLNVLTLGGVAVAVGRLVDDSIVVIENIFRKSQTEKFSISLIMEATKEVGSAITASTLATVAVFLPMGLLEGGLQEFLLPFALTITYSLLASLLVALTVVPLMSAALLKNSRLQEHQPSAKFAGLLTWSLNHKWVVLVTAFVLFAGSIGTYIALPKGGLQQPNADFIDTVLAYPNDTPIDQVKEESLELEKFILEQEEVDGTYLQIGNTADSVKYGNVGSPTKTTIMATLSKDADVEAFITKVQQQKQNYPDASMDVITQSMMGGGSSAITIDILGEDIDKLETSADDVKNAIKDIEGVETVETNQEEKKTVYSWIVDPAKANADQIAQQASVMLNQTPLGTMEIGSQETSVILEPIFDPTSQKNLEEVPIATGKGVVPISEIATLKEEERSTSVYHKDGDKYIRITATVDPEKLSVISKKMKAKIFGDHSHEELALSDGVDVVIGGASVDQADEFTSLFLTMLASIGIVFLIMVITFKTIRAPIVILCTLPLAAIGAVSGILVSRISVDITALLGALMLIGIVVTNAIVLLDRVRQNEKTMIIRDALVEAAAIRMRPILMTAIATICAMLPLLFKEAETGNIVSASLAIVVIGGLSVATLLTLIVIPVVYELLHFKKAKKQRLKREKEKDEVAV